ncbi:hypothetical protein EVAR_47918_1 [Eumeta japonica]|uniref:Secreted protein n=1 Tax=Eumeta variegata TaxID=151549 RepID=A0A4C1Y7X6_EUMVA|nr:hypothetical protein EVAR_47918_1 [Eumeta japonica]
MAVRIVIGAVALIGGAIGCRSRHNFPRNIGRRFLPYKAMNLFPGRVLGKFREQPELVARSLTHRPCMRRTLPQRSSFRQANKGSADSSQTGRGNAEGIFLVALKTCPETGPRH